MTTVRFSAMGTEIVALVPARAWDEARGELVRLFSEWESRLSRFRADSELSALNRSGGTPRVVSRILLDAVMAAIAGARATGGAFDPTLGAHLAQLGYDRTFTDVARDAPPDPAPRRPGGGWRRIWIDAERRLVMLPRAVHLDLGGLAKGMAVDAGLARLAEIGATPALLSAGGDLAATAPPEGQDPWCVAVDGRYGRRLVALAGGAIATSGIARRRWRRGGEERHHLIDPRTGRPAAGDLWSASVAASTCARAEVAATAAFVLGSDRGAGFLASRRLPGLLIDRDGAAHPVGGWPADREAAAA